MRASFVALFSVALLAAGCGEMGSPVSPSSRSTQSVLGGVATTGTRVLAATDRHSLPFKGSLEGDVTLTPSDPPFADVYIAATGTATHLGRFSMEMPHRVSFATAMGAGTITFTAANGDQLMAEFAGHADTSTAIFAIAEQATITGGTGRFAGATGTFAMQRLYNTQTNTTTGSFEGQIAF